MLMLDELRTYGYVEIVDTKINNLYSRLHRLRLKRQKSKIT